MQGLDRYAYANNSPIRYTDPSGHFSKDEITDFFGVENWYQVLVIFDNGDLKDRWGWLLVLESAKIGDKISITTSDQTITGTFDLDPDGDLIIAFPDENYYIDQDKAALLGDSFALKKEIDLSETFCSPYECSYEYSSVETDALRPPLPHHFVPPNNSFFGVEQQDIFDPPTDDFDMSDSRMPFSGGAPTGIIDIFVAD